MTRDEAKEAGRLSAALEELEVGHKEAAVMSPDALGVCEPRVHLPAWVWLEMIEAGSRAVVARLEVLGVSVETPPKDDATSPDDLVPRVLKLSPAMWVAIDDYWHRERLPSRTAAIRALIERGLG